MEARRVRGEKRCVILVAMGQYLQNLVRSNRQNNVNFEEMTVPDLFPPIERNKRNSVQVIKLEYNLRR